MPSNIWNKYKIIKEINNNIHTNIKTYLTRIEPIVKEIIPKNIDEYSLIKEKLEKLKNIIKIYEIIEENERFYVIIDNNDEIISKFDKLLLSEELIVKKEGILKGQGNPISKEEIFDLFKMEESICKILYERIDQNAIKKGKGTGFFCEMNNFPIKYGLFTNNHVLNENNIKPGNIINIEYYNNSSYIKKKIEIDEKRKVFTNEELDYTCIELFESDEIFKYFKIDPILFTNDKNYIKNSDIFILQYPKGNELSFSYGKILSIADNKIYHSASTEEGSSGSPIIRRCKDFYIIGLHYGGIKRQNNINYSFNLATIFDSILNDINKPNVINCIYIKKNKENEIKLLHDYNIKDFNGWEEKYKNLYLEAKEMNKKIFEENIEIYINEKRVKFDFIYKIKDENEIKVKFIFKENLTNTSFMFFNCSSLESIDLSSFNSSEVNNMCYMFYNCKSLKSIDLTSFNTKNVTNMSSMFCECSSLKSIDLTSFNTDNIIDMSFMFDNCSSLKKNNIKINEQDKNLLNLI